MKLSALIVLILVLSACGTSVYGRSGAGGGVGGSRPMVVWAAPEGSGDNKSFHK